MLDTKSDIFQNLNGASNELSLVEIDDNIVLYNNKTGNSPSFFHGNEPTKVSNFSQYFITIHLF